MSLLLFWRIFVHTYSNTNIPKFCRFHTKPGSEQNGASLSEFVYIFWSYGNNQLNQTAIFAGFRRENNRPFVLYQLKMGLTKCHSSLTPFILMVI